MSLVHKVCSVGFSHAMHFLHWNCQTHVVNLLQLGLYEVMHSWPESLWCIFLYYGTDNECNTPHFALAFCMMNETNPLNILMQSLAYCYYFLSFDLSFNMQKPFSSQSSGNAFYCSFIAKINSPNSFFLAYTCTNTFVKETCFVS